MTDSIVRKQNLKKIHVNTNKVLISFTLAFFFIAGLAILQDLLESHRSGYAFYISESLLFKTTWILFIPILAVLYHRLKNEDLVGFRKTILFTIFPIITHFLVFPFIALVLSILFFDGRYDLYKFFSYTLSHDFYTLVIIYAGFVFGYRYFQNHSKSTVLAEEKAVLNKIVISNGKNNTIIFTEDIFQIAAATPYIFIHLENKKHLHTDTLKSICDRLDRDTFVRVHKSTIVNVEKVKSFKSRLNGDYDVQLKNGEMIRLSRTFVPEFKSRFLSSHQDTV